MKKRLLCLLLAGLMSVGLTACGEDPDAKKYALINNNTTEELTAYTQSAWAGVERFGQEQNVKYAQYTPEGNEPGQYEDTIDEAVKEGAEVVVCIGDDMSVPVYQAQKAHKNTKFVLMEAEPHKKKSKEANIRSNTCAIFFNIEQQGFVAGYAAVAEGSRNIGFMGGEDTERNKKLAAGYIQGAEAAAQDLSLSAGAVQLRYAFLGDDKLSPLHMGTALDWYKSGCEVIFAPDEAVGRAAIKAAENQNRKVIGADLDRSGQSPNMLTSAIKDYAGAVYYTLSAYTKDEFKGESVLQYGAKESGPALSLATSTFAAFSQDQYNAMYQKLAGGTPEVTKEIPSTTLVTVTQG